MNQDRLKPVEKLLMDLPLDCVVCEGETIHSLYKIAWDIQNYPVGWQHVCTICGNLRSCIPTNKDARSLITVYKDYDLTPETLKVFKARCETLATLLATNENGAKSVIKALHESMKNGIKQQAR